MIADEHIIKEKIRSFVKYHRRKKTPQVQSQSGTQVSQAPTDVEDKFKCRSCGYGGDLIQHLFESSQCLDAYIERYLPVTEDEVDVQKSIFELSVVLRMCARVDCAQRNDFTYLAAHLNRNEHCLEFYQREGVHLGLPRWSPEASAVIISNKLAEMRRSTNEKKRKEQSYGCLSYKEELSKILDHVCCRCSAMGPVVGEDSFDLRGGWTDANDDPAWFCSKCSEDSPEYDEVKQKLEGDAERLKGPRGSQESDVKIVSCSQSGRLIVAPKCLTEDRPDVPQYAPSLSMRVLVPSDASAIRAIMRWCDETVQDKQELQECVQELLRRPFIANFQATLSCLYRSLIANVRQQMRRIMMGLSKVARGEVLSWNPNTTSARKQTPNLEQTIEGAIREKCNWSLPCQTQKAEESAARSHINGQVKIHIRGTILKAFEDEDLKRILLLGCKEFVNHSITTSEELLADPNIEVFIIKMAPVILMYIKSKVKLFIKHVVAPNYSNHDLRLDIDDQKLEAQIHGYVYAKQFSQVNKMLAANPQTRLLPEVVNRVTAEEDALPTATLDWRNLSAIFKVEELRAKEIIEIASKCQIGDVAFPLSLLNLWTPSELIPSEKEKVLRHRVEELSNERNNDEDVEEAIIDISRRLMEEGLFEELRYEDIEKDVLQVMKRELIELCPDQPPHAVNALMWYHTLLLKTGGRNQWTLKRKCGETLVDPYNPLLLEALQQRVVVRIAVEIEHFQEDENIFEALPQENLMAGFAWKEISILKFLHGISQDKGEDLVSQAIVAVVAGQEEGLNFMEADEKDEEFDDIFINSLNESFIITNGDLRKLYAMRPPAMEDMTFAQFCICYYRKKQRQLAIVDPVSGVGEESTESIVGGVNRAPICMKLSNKVIMKMRSKKSRPVLLLLQSKILNSYGERMLFQPWRKVEELTERQSEEEKEKQKENCLELFPMAIFPGGERGNFQMRKDEEEN